MSDSVGKISLDLEVKSDLGKQINNVSNVMGKTLKDTLNNATKGAFNNVSKNADSAIKNINNSLSSGFKNVKQNINSSLISALKTIKNFKMPRIKFPKQQNIKPNTNNVKTAKSPRGPPQIVNKEILGTQIDNIAATLDNVNARIDQQKEKLAQLRESYDSTCNPNRKNKIHEQILKTESSINKLIGKSDKLGFKLAGLDEKMAGFGSNSVKAATGVNDLSKKTKNFTNKANNSIGVLKRFSSLFKNIGRGSKSTGKSFNGINYGLQNTINQMFKWMIILPMIVKGLTAMASGLLANLKTNQQFVNSLAQIKTNLMVAFTPIYQAILPAINALMSALATLTTYIASFTSAIFGKTYQQSYQATQQLIDAKKEMGAYGEAAKKTKKELLGLAAFDEINLLNKNNDNEDDSKVPKLVQPPLDTSQVDSEMNALADKIKNIFSQIFAPMKAAWDKEGKATIDAFKYALREVLQLTKDIGKSFLNVWTNGTGQKVCENILKLLQTVLNIIGDIAKAFDTAWNKGNLGTKVIQAMFNSLNSILELLGVIGNTFRDVWNDGTGVEICTNILEILKNMFTITGQIADSFKNAWDAGLGKQIITDILNLLNGCLRIIKDITASFSNAWITNGDTICNGILLILDNIFGTVSDIANSWANAWEDNGAGDTLMNSLLETLGKIFNTIGDIGSGIRESFGNIAEEVFSSAINFITNISDGLGNITDGLKLVWDNGGKHLFDGIVSLAAKIGELVLQIGGNAFKNFGEIFRDVIAPALGKVLDVLVKVVEKLVEFINWISKCTPLVKGLSIAITALGTALIGAKIAKTILGVVESFKTLITIIKLVFSSGVLSGLAEVGSAMVAAVGGWPIVIGAAIVAIGVVIYKNWDAIKEKTSAIWNGIKEFLKKWGVDIVAALVGGPFGLITVEVFKNWDAIKQKTTEVWSTTKDWLETTWSSIKESASSKWSEIKETISTKWLEIKEDTSNKWNETKEWLTTTWSSIKETASKKWSEMKETISTKWNEIKTNTSTKWAEINTYLNTTWNNISTTAATKWEEIKQSISAKWDELKNNCSSTWENIKIIFSNIIDWVKTTFSSGWASAWNGISSTFARIFNGLFSIAKKPLNAIIGMVNKVIDGLNKIQMPDWVPLMGGKGINIPHIPALAKGGIVDSPTLSMVGEAGKEAVVPLENNTGGLDLLANKLLERMGGNQNNSNNDSNGGDLILMMDSSILGKIALKELRKRQRQGNITLIPT